MSFVPPFHDDSRVATGAALIARVQQVVGVPELLGIVETFASPTAFDECRVWSRHERPVAVVGLGYDWIRVGWFDGYADIRKEGRSVDEWVDLAAAVVIEPLRRVDALGPREPGDVGGDEPSERPLRDLETPDDPAEWTEALFLRLLDECGFGPGNIDLPVVLPAIERWAGQAAPRTAPYDDVLEFELYDAVEEGDTMCAEAPSSLGGGDWIGVGFGRSVRGTDPLVGGQHGLTLWYAPDEEWRALLQTLPLVPESVVSLESYGTAGSFSRWLLDWPGIRPILDLAERKKAALAVRWSDDEWEIPGSAGA